MAGFGLWDKTKQVAHRATHRLEAETKWFGHKTLITPYQVMRDLVRRGVRYGIWPISKDPILVDMERMNLLYDKAGNIDDPYIRQWFNPDQNGAWVFQPGQIRNLDVVNANPTELRKVTIYLDSITEPVAMFYRESAPRTPTDGAKVRLPTFLVAQSGFKQEQFVGSQLARAMRRVGSIGTRDYLQHLDIADKIHRNVITDIMPWLIGVIAAGTATQDDWGAAVYLFARYLHHNHELDDYLEDGHGRPGSHKELIAEAAPIAARLCRAHYQNDQVAPTQNEVNRIKNLILNFPQKDKFGAELVTLFRDLASPLREEERLILAAVLCAGARVYVKLANASTQKHVEHASRALQLFGAVAGFIPMPGVAPGVGLVTVLADTLLHHFKQSPLDKLEGVISAFAARIDHARPRSQNVNDPKFLSYLQSAMLEGGFLP